ncbi:lipoate--protein ligase family protein [Candidatus Woesearchaeota archaeon]|nr:lipoate--protein ligase family protein [Candidatus Woesearchaeota archaeon]
MKWRFISFSENAAAMNMAIDESIMEHVRSGKSAPTIRFYSWQPSAITLGTFQCRGDEVDMEAVQHAGVDVVRRITGGGAVYHDRFGEITYSIIAPESLIAKEILRSYEEICSCIVSALQSLGITAVFKPINDIIADMKKISGSAQTRRGGVLLQHGTILFDVDVDTMFSLLKVDKVKVSDKFVQSVKKVVTSVRQQNSLVSRDQLMDALMTAFLREKSWENGALSESELAGAKVLSLEKYSSEAWNNCRV